MTGKHIEWMERIMFVIKLPFKCYMDWCGGKGRLEAKIAKKRQGRAAQLNAQFGPAAPAVRDEPAVSSPARSKNTTVNADVPIFSAPIVVSAPLSGINFKDFALGADLVRLQDVGVNEAQPRLAVGAPDLCVETMSDFLIGGRRRERGDSDEKEAKYFNKK
jgi:hypothetical protein